MTPTSARPADRNRLFLGDCLAFMAALPDESVDLIYVDPPFCTGKRRRASPKKGPTFADAWHGGLTDYVAWLGTRLTEMRRLLKPTGTIYVHLDWHASHYVKVEMDRIFGYERFLNEIAWCYNVGGKSPRCWARKHDAILFYAKGAHWYFDGKSVGLPRETGTKSFGGIIAFDIDGRRYQDKLVRTSGKYYRYYLDEPKVPEDWWTDINSIQSQAAERVGYPTQKPRALLRRIVRSSAPPDGVVADFFCGSGTTLAVAEEEGRRWIGCDANPAAVELAARRLGAASFAQETAP